MNPLLIPAKPVWRLDPGLAEKLPAGLPDLNTYPVQENVLPGEWPPYFRPRGHWRALYRWESWGCLAVKGGEAHTSRYDLILEAMQSQTMDFRYRFSEPAGQARLTILERFLFLENKFPGMVRLHEALEEAELAAAFQAAHLKQYGQLARVPLPLVVHQIPDSLGQTIAQQLCAQLQPRHHSRVYSLLPLGVLLYWYPTLPERVAHLRLPEHLTQAERLATLRRQLQPEQLVEDWLELLTRTLQLGWVPCDPCSSLQGMCLEAQNLTLDGGMVDLDSLRPLDSFRDARPAVERCFEILAQSIALFLTGKPGPGLAGPIRQKVLGQCRHSPHPLLREMAAEDVFTATLNYLS